MGFLNKFKTKWAKKNANGEYHFLFTEVGGKLAPQVTEVDDVAWFPIEEIVSKLAYTDERKLIAKSGQLTP